MIDTDQKLAEFLPQLAKAEWVAVDTEADSLHAYPEKLCLLQISIPGADRLIDPLAKLDVKPLLELLRGRELLLHGADYDLRLLRRAYGFVPTQIFDTMLAARLLGEKRFGLDHLVHHYLGVKLEKGPQKANWGRRPLTARMEAYARADTHWLKPLSDALRERLEKAGRLDWHREACDRLIADCSQARQIDPDQAWRLKGCNRLTPAAQAILRQIWLWREKEALAANKPPYFILKPEVMLNLAEAAGKGSDPARLVPAHLTGRRRQGLLKAIETGRHAPPPTRPPRVPHHRPTEAERRRMAELIRRRDRKAAELGIDPAIIASRSMLGQLARDWEACQHLLMAWQRELLANP